MGTPFAGLRGTGDFQANERPEDYRELILRMEPNGAAPLYALMSQMNVESAADPIVNWFEETLDVPRLLSITTFVTATAAFPVETTGTGTRFNATALVAGDLLLVEQAMVTAYTHTSSEIVQFVSTNGAATSITVLRGAAGTTARESGANAFLTKIGNAFAEGSGSPTGTSRNPVLKSNYCQIFKTSYNITGTALAIDNLRTGNVLKNDRMRKLFDHSAAIEQALFFGRRFATSTDGEFTRYMGGLTDPTIGIPFNHVPTATATFVDTLMGLMEPLFQQTLPGISDERIAFCGNGWLNKLNSCVRLDASSQVQFAEMIEVYGMNLQKIRFPFGTIAFKTHPLLNRNTRYTNSMFVIAPPTLTLRPLRDTVEQKNIQDNDADQIKNQYLTELAVEINHPSLSGHFHHSGS